MARMIIAVDGPAASGKGTLTARLANHFDLARVGHRTDLSCGGSEDSSGR